MRYSLGTLIVLLFLVPPIFSTVIAAIEAARICEANSRPARVCEPKPAAYGCLITPRILIVEEEESLL